MMLRVIPKKKLWSLYIQYYLLIVPFWLLLAFLFYNYTSLFGRINYLIVLLLTSLTINPILAGIIVIRKLWIDYGNGELKSLLVPIALTHLLSFCILSAPWLIATFQENVYKNSDLKTVENIQLEAKKTNLDISDVNYSYEVDILSSKWIQFEVGMSFNLPNNLSSSEVKDFLSNIKFNRDTIIKVKIIRPNNYSFYEHYYYNIEKQEIE